MPALAHPGVRREAALELPALPQSVAAIRSLAAEMARALPFSATDCDDIVMATGEAAANAVRHGRTLGPETTIAVRCICDPGFFVLEITDRGDGFDPEGLCAPDARRCREGGLGIFLMRRVMDEVSYTFDARGTTVRLVKRLPPGSCEGMAASRRAAPRAAAA
jgi:serine/threonine-protein kinase RsbW